MTHLDEGRLLDLRDDASGMAVQASGHLSACAVCRSALDDAVRRKASVAEHLAALDPPSWDVDGARDRVRRRLADDRARDAGSRSLFAGRGRWAAWGVSKAAGLLLITAAGLAALPGSPVRLWIGRMVVPPAAESPAPAASPAPTATFEEAGVRIPLQEGPLSVVLRDVAADTEIRVRWIPGREAAVFAPAGSRFVSGKGRVEAHLRPGGVRVELPRSVLPITLEVDGRVILRSTEAGLEVSGPVAERTDGEITFRWSPP